ncbi:hypothetical protein GCM10027416_11170 [Okibacterium endophyticum]
MDRLRLSDLRRHGDVRQERRAQAPAYAAEADRLALADAVSTALVRYRAEHGLTQSALAARLGWDEAHVARLGRGDETPSSESLERLARAGIIT